MHKAFVDTNKIFAEIVTPILTLGSKALSDSTKKEKYNVSLREIFGLCVILELRKYLEPEKKWFINTEINDDGIIGYLLKSGENIKVGYWEKIEQVYLPGKYLERNPLESANRYIIKHTIDQKGRGSQYERGVSLFVLNDINSLTPFYWAEFAKDFFTVTEFLHLYFLALEKHTPNRNKYYLVSFTNQVHRQYLNGIFNFSLTKKGIEKFTRTEDLTLALRGLPKVSSSGTSVNRS